MGIRRCTIQGVQKQTWHVDYEALLWGIARDRGDKLSVSGLVDDWVSSGCIEDTAASKPGVFPI